MDSLVGVDFGSYAYNATVQEKLADGQLVELGSGSTVNVEAALELNPDVIMTSASGSADFDTHPKLQEVGLTVVLNADYLDITPSGSRRMGQVYRRVSTMKKRKQTHCSTMSQRRIRHPRRPRRGCHRTAHRPSQHTF